MIYVLPTTKTIIFGKIRAQSKKIAKKGRFQVTQNYKTRIDWPFIDRNGMSSDVKTFSDFQLI